VRQQLFCQTSTQQRPTLGNPYATRASTPPVTELIRILKAGSILEPLTKRVSSAGTQMALSRSWLMTHV
jgi:hypothetical protein